MMTPKTERSKAGLPPEKTGTHDLCKTVGGEATNPTNALLHQLLERAVKNHEDLMAALDEEGVTPTAIARAIKEGIENRRSFSDRRKYIAMYFELRNWTPKIQATQTNVVVQQPPPGAVHEEDDDEAEAALARAAEAERARGK